MISSDRTCPDCGAGFRRIELAVEHGSEGEYRCPACDAVLEILDGKCVVAYRMTILPSARALHSG
ncbi:hypothetical protein JQ625_05915 [Bradyrhizobium diazoefficiens]|nr:hypothetical protein [Bradyrhizobium diazoefficiens]MBR0774365.1 hypothetical protein [Bradyrhizobium diazoefficiens]